MPVTPEEKLMDGLWTAEFGTTAGTFGGGVAVLFGGKLLGGDGTYFYVGHYQLNGKDFQAKLKSSPFITGAVSVFKTVGTDLSLEITGSLADPEHLIGVGHALGMENLGFAVKLTRRA